jgi:hypothetical protein
MTQVVSRDMLNIKNIISKQAGYEYLYITGFETSKPYKQNTQVVFGIQNSFFLDTDIHAWET